MAVLGLMLVRIGFRFTMCVGGFAYFLRYLIFGTTSLPVEVIVTSQALHGLCFGCFFAAAFIYVDRLASDDVRSSAQTVFGITILGLGPIISAPVLAFLTNVFTPEGGTLNYSYLWYTLAAIACVTTLAFGIFFRDETSGPVETQGPEEEPVAG